MFSKESKMRFTIRMRCMGVLSFFTALILATDTFAQRPAQPDYRAIVVSYVDTLMEHGRDKYGNESSPLVAALLDKDTMRLFDEAGRKRLFQIRLQDWDNWGIRNGDRCFSGANPMLDQNLYQILYALSKIDDEPKRRSQADEILKWFFENCQSKDTGLFAWGEHASWDFFTDQVVDKEEPHLHHEFARPWVLWDRSFELCPEQCHRFALGLWEHQIANHETGDFSRHAGYLRHRTAAGDGYPRHGGFYINTWAEAFRRSKNPVLIRAIETLLSHYETTAHPDTGAIPCCTQPARREIVWPESNLSLAVDMWDAAKHVPDELADRLRKRALKTDAVYLRIKHDFGPNGVGFIAGADAATLAARTEGGWTNTDMWATSYGKTTDAAVAILCVERFRQTNSEAYRRLIVDCGQRYLTGGIDREAGLHPKTLGLVICLMLECEKLTGMQDFLRRAEFFARKGVKLFLSDGPLPSATVKYRHYEAISGADTLMMSFLRLWLHKERPDVLNRVQLSFCDR